jgi:hypothetical protein
MTLCATHNKTKSSDAYRHVATISFAVEVMQFLVTTSRMALASTGLGDHKLERSWPVGSI